MNRQEFLESACPECKAPHVTDDGEDGPWQRQDESQDWGALGVGERWHCYNCDAYRVINPWDELDHEPNRGDYVEAWIKHWRDIARKNLPEWSVEAFSLMLDQYRLLADKGKTLKEALAEDGVTL